MEKKYKSVTKLFGSRIFLIGVIALLIIMMLKQCRDVEQAEEEAKREHNNYLAALDSVRVIKKDRDNVIFEKSSFERKISELTEHEKDLIKKLGLKSNGKGNTPSTVIETVIQYRDTGRVVTSLLKGIDGKDSISFVYNPAMPGKNSFYIGGKTPYVLNLTRDKNDSSKYHASISVDSTRVDVKQSIELVTGIYRDPKSKRLMTRVSTSFPGLELTDVNSFDITDNPDTRRILKKARKELGLGLTLGYGFTGNANGIRPGILVGVGLHYTPRFLQFGK